MAAPEVNPYMCAQPAPVVYAPNLLVPGADAAADDGFETGGMLDGSLETGEFGDTGGLSGFGHSTSSRGGYPANYAGGGMIGGGGMIDEAAAGPVGPVMPVYAGIEEDPLALVPVDRVRHRKPRAIRREYDRLPQLSAVEHEANQRDATARMHFVHQLKIADSAGTAASEPGVFGSYMEHLMNLVKKEAPHKHAFKPIMALKNEINNFNQNQMDEYSVELHARVQDFETHYPAFVGMLKYRLHVDSGEVIQQHTWNRNIPIEAIEGDLLKSLRSVIRKLHITELTPRKPRSKAAHETFRPQPLTASDLHAVATGQ